MKKLIIGLAILSLSVGCASTRPSATVSSGNVAIAMSQWETSSRANPSQPAPAWTLQLYKQQLKTINHLEAEIKELKNK